MERSLCTCWVGVLVVVTATLALAGCSGRERGPHSLAAIQARGKLVVLTRNAPTTYYIGNTGHPAGPEYQMVVAFAKFIGVKPKFVVEDSVAALLTALANGHGDMIAAGITRTADRQKRFAFGPSYQTVTQEVVCGRSGKQPTTVADLQSARLEVIAKSSYVSRLRKLQKKHPELRWTVVRNGNTETLLRQVWKSRLDCTIADSNIVAINRRYFPNLKSAFAISEPQPLGWVVPKGRTGSLRAAMRRWMRRYKSSGELRALMEEYYGHAQIFDYVGVRAFKRKIKSVWPKYQPLFDKAADEYALPPLILAAQAYQESHWNPHAKSPTGVRGMMMLTLDTARAFGVKNRLNAAQSIRGGARYLAHLERRLDDDIPERQRLWFALAAYNIGFSHLRDARMLAKRLGKNPDDWQAIAKVLPLLAEKRYYRRLPNGYARGLLPVRYVRRIRNYADILRTQIHTDTVASGGA